MPCLPQDYGYMGSCKDNVDWHNWLGNVRYVVPRYFVPATRQDLVSILQEAEAQGKKVKAVGRGWSYEDCAASKDWVVDIALLENKITFLTDEATGAAILTPAWYERQFRASREKLYHVEAGIRLYKLNKRLEEDA
jgi:FAD/FMN-containing dehydrogenase